MKGILLTAIILIGTIETAWTAEVSFPGGGFEDGSNNWVMRKGAKLSQDSPHSGKYCLELPAGNTSYAMSRRFTVEPGKIYCLSFMGKVSGEDTLDNNPGLKVLRRKLKKERKLPKWELCFYRKDKKGKRVSRGFPQFFTCILSENWTQYREEFHVPPGAGAARLVFTNGNPDNTLFIDDLELDQVFQPELNINPEFKLGEDNFSGYNYSKNCKIIDAGDGKFVLDAMKGWSMGDPIPARPEQTLQLSYSAKAGPGRNGLIRCVFCDATRKELGTTKTRDLVTPRGTEKTCSYTFVTPPGTAYVRLVPGWAVFKWIKLTEKKASKE